MFRTLLIAMAVASSGTLFAQGAPGTPPTKKPDPKSTQDADEQARKYELQLLQKKRDMMQKAESRGVMTRLKDISKFRGVWANQLMGYGLVVGLDATGDSKKFAASSRALANMMKRSGLDVDPANSDSKNVALVAITAELPAFAAVGQRLDLTVSTIGDAKSLRGGTLIYGELKYPNRDEVFATASGSVSVGGFSASAGGNSASKNFVTVGKIPGGAIIQESVPTQTLFGNKMFLDLDSADITTAQRVEEKINEVNPNFKARAVNGGSIEVQLPIGMSVTQAQSKLEEINVESDIEAKVIVDEKTGTIVVGGNVRIAPCMIASGSISVKIDEELLISQPGAFSSGQTVVVPQKTLNAKEANAEIAVLRPNTTVADLATIFQSLKLKASDIINILREMHAQGSLKAKLVIE